MKKTSKQHVSPLLKNSVNTIIANPIILYPLCILAFIQLLTLEILYFAPRWPLKFFFGPLIAKIWGEPFLHYPFNFQLLPKLFYYTQIPTYILIGSLLSALTVSIVYLINSGKKANLKNAARPVMPLYVYIITGAILIYLTVFVFLKGYEVLFLRALKIRSESGPFFWLKSAVIYGRPYFNLLIDMFVTALYAFVFPVIVIERAKITRALRDNFKYLKGAFGFILLVVAVPTILYVPVLMLRSIVAPLALTLPVLQGLVIILSIFVKLIVESIVLTATTTYYLTRKEDK